MTSYKTAKSRRLARNAMNGKTAHARNAESRSSQRAKSWDRPPALANQHPTKPAPKQSLLKRLRWILAR